jgi:hypothetical protein
MPHPNQRNKRLILIYGHRKVTYQRKFQQKARNRFSFGARVQIGSGTESKEQIGHKCSKVHDPCQLRLNFQFGSAVH